MAQQAKTTIRPLQAADLEAVVEIDRARSGRARAEFFARRLRPLDADPASLVGVAAERRSRVVGFAFARVQDGEFGGAAPVGVLDAISVTPAAERDGVATALLAGLEAALAARGAGELRSQVDWTEHGMAAFLNARGFRLAPRVVLERPLDRPVDGEGGDQDGDEAVVVRSMAERDAAAIERVDRKITGRDRSAYLRRKAEEVLRRSAVRVSLVAEVGGELAGFLMARFDFGEFGRAEPTAVLDTIGVEPAFGRRGVGRALLEQLLRNVGSLRAEQVVTEVGWNDLALLGFLGRTGFGHSQRLAFDKAIA